MGGTEKADAELQGIEICIPSKTGRNRRSSRIETRVASRFSDGSKVVSTMVAKLCRHRFTTYPCHNSCHTPFGMKRIADGFGRIRGIIVCLVGFEVG
jgi:hypothetical protein